MIVSRSFRLHISLLCLMAVSGLMGSAAHSAEKISDQIEVKISQLHKARARDQFTVDVTLKNRSETDFEGSIVLVVKGTGVRGLVLTEPDGHLPNGQAYLNVISAKRSLKAGAETTLKGVSLDASPLLKSDELEKFSLQTDVYRISEESKTTDPRQQNTTTGQPIVPGPFPNPSGTGGGSSSGGNSIVDKPAKPTEPVKPLEPTPDPAFTEKSETPAEKEQKSDRGYTTKRPRIPTDEEVAEVIKTQNNWNERVLKIEGVHSVGTGWGKDGSAVISVQVSDFEQKKLVPATIDGTPVEVFVAQAPKLEQTTGLPDDYDNGNRARAGIFTNIPGCFQDPKDFFPRPTPIGVSGWNAKLRVCSTGTLGCRLVAPGGQQYILSNSHVLANFGLFSISGSASIGDLVVQPGPADLNCAIAPDSGVGTLAAFSGISFTMNNVTDSAIALTDPLLFSTATPCDGYGTPRQFPENAFLGMEVMKYGRTTRFTVGDVAALNVTSTVIIDPVSGQTAMFAGLIQVNSNFAYGRYSAGGDSGSLTVSRLSRRPVGLHFAGNVVSALEIPIDTVLTIMSMQIGLDPMMDPLDILTVDGEP